MARVLAMDAVWKVKAVKVYLRKLQAVFNETMDIADRSTFKETECGSFIPSTFDPTR